MFYNELNPKELTLSAIVVANILVDELNSSEIDSLGNWFTLVGQYLETVAAFQSAKENYLQKININTNTKKYRKTNNPFSDNDNSTLVLRKKIEEIKKIIHKDN